MGKKHVLVKKLSKSAAKKLKFEPIESSTWPGHFYLGPDDLDEEEGRILLHPYEDKPREHILFGFRGIEAPKQINGKPSEMGEESIKVYELFNGNLRRARQNAQQNAASAFVEVTWPGHFYLGPDDLDEEEGRILLHPYEDKPREHILFGFRGIEAPKQINGKPSEMGEESIKVYELFNGNLRRARQNAQQNAASAFLVAFLSAVQLGKPPNKAKQAAHQALAQMLGNAPPYSAAIDDYLRSVKKELGG